MPGVGSTLGAARLAKLPADGCSIGVDRVDFDRAAPVKDVGCQPLKVHDRANGEDPQMLLLDAALTATAPVSTPLGGWAQADLTELADNAKLMELY